MRRRPRCLRRKAVRRSGVDPSPPRGLRWRSAPHGQPERAAMNKGGLVAEVSKRTGLSKADAGRAVDAAIDSIRESVVRGDRVTLADFGTFERKHRNERIARNPRRPQIPIVVPARDLPAFTPGKEFREQVVTTTSNGGSE